MKTEAALLSAIAGANTLREQAALVAELDALRQANRVQAQASRDWDAAGTVVEQTLSPVLTHSFHTASTDWLSEADIPAVDTNRVHAEAALWFGKTASFVKQDDEEFTEQAKGVARRLASQFGEQAPQAERAFMDYVAFLLRREAASGLDQIQQTVGPDGKKKTTPLPTETMDTFQPPISPENQGIDEMQSTENAPLLNEILQAGQGQGTPEVANGHSTSQTFTGPTTNGSGMQVGASLVDSPSVAQGYLYNLDDFRSAQAAIQQTAAREASDDSEDSPSGDLRASAGWREDVGINDELANEAEDERKRQEEEDKKKSKSKKEAASGLPQVQQVVDAEENPAPTALPLDVAFPLIPYFEQGKKQSAKIASSVDEMLQQGSDNDMLDKTHNGSEKSSPKPTNAMEKATKSASLDKTAAQEFQKAAAFAANWKPGQPIVRQGSAAFEAGLYAGISANSASQQAWLDAHAQWGMEDRIERHAAMSRAIQRSAATSTDLDEMSAGNGLSQGPGMDVPIQGPGTKPPLAGGMDPAAPGGAAMYNGAEPFSKPVAPDPGVPSRKTQAFRERVQASLGVEAAEGKSPVCRGCGEAFETRAIAEKEHGKKGCGTEDGERGYEMKKNSEAW